MAGSSKSGSNGVSSPPSFSMLHVGSANLPAHSCTCTTQKFTNKKHYSNCADLHTLGSYLHWTFQFNPSLVELNHLTIPITIGTPNFSHLLNIFIPSYCSKYKQLRQCNREGNKNPILYIKLQNSIQNLKPNNCWYSKAPKPNNNSENY